MALVLDSGQEDCSRTACGASGSAGHEGICVASRQSGLVGRRVDERRRRRIRAQAARILSTLGVTIGSAAIVLVVTAGLTGGRYVIDQIEGVGSNLTYAELMRTGAPQPASISDEMTPGRSRRRSQSDSGCDRRRRVA